MRPPAHAPSLFDPNETAGRGGSGGAPARPVSRSYLGTGLDRGAGAGSRFVGAVGRIPGADQRRAAQLINAPRPDDRRPEVAGMKDIGLVGVPFSGKSTLFTAVTRAGSHGGQANLAVVPVPDPRVDVLTRMERSAKTVHAQVRFVDVPGGVSSAQGVARLREADALAIVVRCFGNGATPASELAAVRAELLLADLAVVESALAKAEKRAKGQAAADVDALRRAKEALDAERALRDADLSEADRVELKGIAPLTMKPEVVVANLEEGASV